MVKYSVSVIVPVYGVEKYIDKCLKSLVSQTLKDIEIIVVNDGSKDKTLDVLQALSLEDKRIKVIDQINSGVSQARNNGLKNASGKYIGFVDADDYIDVTMYEKMYKKAEDNNCEIVICNVNDVKGEEKKVSLCLEEGIINMDMIIKEDFLCEKYCKLGTAVWHKIFKSELIKNNNIKLLEKCFYTDTEYAMYPMIYSKTIYISHDYIYVYRVGRDEQSMSAKGRVKHYKDHIKVSKKLNDFVKENCNHLEENIKKYIVEYTSLMSSATIANYIMLLPCNKENLELIKEFENYILEERTDVYKTMKEKSKVIRTLRNTNYLAYKFLAYIKKKQFNK